MKSSLRLAGAFIALAFSLLGAGCVAQPVNTANTTTTNSTTTTMATPVSSPEIVKTNESAELPVTLPLLDAFFHEETFAAELKTKLGLTDEQVEKLRRMAREETGRLRESDADNYNGTTTAARAHATEQIKALIGDEKTMQLTALLSEKWSGAGDEASGDSSAQQTAGGPSNASNTSAAHGGKSGPNAVPTDTRIVVNAPAYRMDVFDAGRLVKSYKIGIGYPEFPLPTGQRKANSIIFNPSWTPPDEPWVEASDKIKAGQKVEAGSKLNPLGPIKIPIGLPSLIHGGKSPSRLGGFASHGCVGLTTPQVEEFARELAGLSGTQLTDEQVNAYAQNPKETKEVKLARSVPVELRYETIVVEDGQLHIYRDVYDRNTNTEENLRAVLETYGVTLEQLSEAERTAALNALKEMSRDANGKLDELQPAANANTAQGAERNQTNNANAKASEAKTKASEAKKSAANSIQVTRFVKGKKEIVIQIAALQGKGYPAPLELNTGGASKKAATATAPASRRR